MSTRIQFNSAGFREVLTSPGMARLVEGEAQRVAARANGMSSSGGYSSDVKQMGSRVIASAYTDTPAAMIDNGRRQTLLRALGGGR